VPIAHARAKADLDLWLRSLVFRFPYRARRVSFSEKTEAGMLGWCLAYVGVSLAFGALLGTLGYRHQVWSRAHLRRDTLCLV
jgi:hypothetical protein